MACMETVDRLLAVPVVIECDVVEDEFAVEPHSHILALHDHVEVIPVAAVILAARPVRAAEFFVVTNGFGSPDAPTANTWWTIQCAASVA